MAISMGNTPDEPMSEMNTTPLIDVMLVLLIMLIMTVPLSTHALQVDLPSHCDNCPHPDATKNKITLDARDTIRWNGFVVDRQQLSALLRQSLAMPVEPELQFEPAPNASYLMSAELMNDVRQSGVTKFGFVGNEKYRKFGAPE